MGLETSTTTARRDRGALDRFLRVHGIERRVASGRAFLVPVGAPAAAPSRPLSHNVRALPGTYQLAVSREAGGPVEIGLLYGCRSDLRGATFLAARELRSLVDVQATCGELDRLTHSPRRPRLSTAASRRRRLP